MQKDDKEKRIDAGGSVHTEHFAPSDHSRFIPGGYDSLPEPEASVTTEPATAPEPASAPDVTSAPEPTPQPNDAPQDSTDSDNTVIAKICHAISWLMVPLLMPVYGIILIFALSILNVADFTTKLSFTTIIFAINVVFPAVIIYILKVSGKINDVGLNGRTERLIPYIVCIVTLGASAWFMASRHAPVWVSMFYAGGAASGIVNLLINFKWKISAHAAGVAGIVAILIRIARDGYPQGDIMLWILIAILAAGITGSARLYLGRHTFWQVMAGYATGFFGVFLMTMIH